jgi:gliding motility-associated-like protein
MIPGPDCACTLAIEDIPDEISFCPDDVVVLNPMRSGGHGAVTSAWLTPQGMIMQPSLTLNTSGQYIWIVRDSIGCEERDTFNVNVPDSGSIDLGVDITIEKGDSVLIQPVVAGIDILSVTWDPPFPGIGIESFWFTPESTTRVTLMISDSAGCVFSDEKLVTVFVTVRLYIPSIFSPNGDGINDEIIVHTNIPVDRILSLEIFDRWGNKLHGQYESAPLRWDGTYRGKEASSGVYVYRFSWLDEQGNIQVRVGDITLIK